MMVDVYGSANKAWVPENKGVTAGGVSSMEEK